MPIFKKKSKKEVVVKKHDIFDYSGYSASTELEPMLAKSRLVDEFYELDGILSKG